MAISNKLESFDPAKKVGGLLEEFKNFAFKGNMIDLAIGVIIGAAFGGIVNSLVKNIFMPLISLVLPGSTGYQDKQWVLTTTIDKSGNTVPGIVVMYGQFLADLLNFVAVAFVVFIFLKKFMGLLTRSKEQAAAAPPPPTKDQELLTEIRDLLKQRTV
jgi:large conductance mechanosensitive channel